MLFNRYTTIRSKMILLALIPVALFLALNYFYIRPNVSQIIYEAKESQTQAMVDTGIGVLKHFYSLEQQEILSREEAQKKALEVIKNMRFGPNNLDYFWVNDYHPRMVMHPLRSELDGEDLSSYTDSEGFYIFNEFVELATKDGSGFVEYQWQYYGDEARIEPKLSYVRDFTPWEWVIGTGIYLNDINEIIRVQQEILHSWSFMIALLIVILSFLVGWRIVSPINAMTRHSQLIAEGDMNRTIAKSFLNRTDEIGALARAFDEMSTARKKFEEKLSSQKEHFEALFKNTTDAIAYFDKEHKIYQINDKFTKLFGYSIDEVKGENINAIIDPQGKTKEYASPRILQGEVVNVETTRYSRTGRNIEVVLKGGPVYVDGVMVGGYAIYTDITSRKKAEKRVADYTLELELNGIEMEELYHQLDEEMNKAKVIHENILPKNLPYIERVSFATYYQPAYNMGGDFYDFIKIGNKLVFYLSDVSGHGLGGAMMSIFVKNTISNYLTLVDYEDIMPEKIMKHVFCQFNKEGYPDDYFICLLICVLDIESLSLTYIGKGFQFPFISYIDGKYNKLFAGGLPISSTYPLGMVDFQEKEITLTANSTLLFYTDGIIEEERNGELYAVGRLEKILAENHFLPVEIIKNKIINDYYVFSGSTKGQDDITFLMLQTGWSIKK